MKLTQEIINKGFKAKSKTYEVADNACPGLFYRITPAGKKSWVLDFHITSGQRFHRTLRLPDPYASLALVRDIAREKIAETRRTASFPDDRVRSEYREKIQNEALAAAAPTLADVFEMYVTIAAPTAKIKNNIKKFQKLWEKKAGDITEADVLTWADSEMRSSTILDSRFISTTKKNILKHQQPLPGISAHSANLCIRELMRMLRWAAQRDYIRLSIAQTPRISEPPTKNIRYLKPNEYQQLMTTLQKNHHEGGYWMTAVFLAVHTGLRMSALFGLVWGDIEWETRKIRITADKTGNIRRIDFSQEVENALQEWKQKKTKGLTETDRILGPTAVKYRKWHQICAAANIETIRWHDLRHTFCTYLAAAGASMTEIAAAAGHQNISTTAKYVHIMKPENLTLERLENFITTETAPSPSK